MKQRNKIAYILGMAMLCMPIQDVSAQTSIAKEWGLGWNLGNQYDAFENGISSETAWHNDAPGTALMDSISKAGFTAVRIPVTWLGHIGKAPEYKLDKTWLQKVTKIVEQAEKAGLKAIINIHHDGADSQHWLNIREASQDPQKNAQIEEEIEKVWYQIAKHFRKKGDFLMFEAMNEIHDGGWGWGDNRKDNGKQYAILSHWTQVFTDAVRKAGGKNANRWLGIPSYCTNPQLALDSTFVLPKDKANKLMVAVHFYDPYEYVLNDKYSEWGHTANPEKKESWGDESNVDDLFEKLNNKFVKVGIPVYLGEMGCVRRNSQRGEQFRRYYLEYVVKKAKDEGIIPFYWDNGYKGIGKEQSGLFDRATGAFHPDAKEVTQAMRKAMFDNDPNYTIKAVYDNAPSK